jgi:Zn-finger nucleic acid-binding protein
MLEHDTPGPAGDSIFIDRCTADRSCGTWYDRGEYAAIDPRLANSASRDALVHSVRAPVDASAQPLSCPRCADNTSLQPVRFVGVILGLCPRCSGVWAPNGAITAVINALSLHEAREGSAIDSHYRSAAAAPVMRDSGAIRTTCVDCRQLINFNESNLSEDGLLCVLCASKRERRETNDNAGLWSFVRAVLRDLGLR